MTTDANVPVRFGVTLPQGLALDLVELPDPIAKYEAMTRVARAADQLPAYDSIWVCDHLWTWPTPQLEPSFECWTATAGLARDTQRVNIGQRVTCNLFRHPALLAKMASTVDVMSHGRLYVGLGAGWWEQEARAYGYAFPGTAAVMGMFAEACQIIHRMFTEDYPEFAGRYYAITRPINEPKGVRQPHPPIWLGGAGERVTLRLVARWGDACHLPNDPDALRRKLGVLRRHCDEVGRDHREIIAATGMAVHLVGAGDDPVRATARARGRQGYEEYARDTWVGTPAGIVARLEPLIAAGARYFVVTLARAAYDTDHLAWFADEVIARVRAA